MLIRSTTLLLLVLHQKDTQSFSLSPYDRRIITAFERCSYPNVCLRRRVLLYGQSYLNDETNDDEEIKDETDEGNEPIYFDDFGEDVLLGSDSEDFEEVNMSFLSSRISDQQSTEMKRDARIAKNWKDGNWSVRGFSLDSTNALTVESESMLDEKLRRSNEASAQRNESPVDDISNDEINVVNVNVPQESSSNENRAPPIHVSCVALDTEDEGCVDTGSYMCVGRTDGSVCVVRIGTEFITQFASQNTIETESVKKAYNGGESAKMSGVAAKIRQKWVAQPSMGEISDLSTTVGDDANGTEPSEPKTPFEVLFQMQSPHPSDNNAISGLLLDGTLLFSSSKDGSIQYWELPGTATQRGTPELTVLREPSENDAIIKLGSITHDELELVYAVSEGGNMLFFDKHTKSMVASIQLSHNPNYEANIQRVQAACAFDHYLFLGISDGKVHSYDLSSILSQSTKKSDALGSLEPNGIFRASMNSIEGVTALECGVGVMGRGTTKSVALITGDADGYIKQWEIFPRQVPNDDNTSTTLKLEHWPKLSTQKIQRRAHVFQSRHTYESTGDPAPVTGLASSATHPQLLSCGRDGQIIVWSPISGDALYSLQGFTNHVNSLCLDHRMLITNGMEGLVCLHDFGAETMLVEEGTFELGDDW